MKKIITLILAVLMLTAIVCVPTFASAATSVSLSWHDATVDNEAGVVYIRAAKNNSSEILATLHNETAFEVKGDTNNFGFYRARYNGITGFCAVGNVEPDVEREVWFSGSTLKRGFEGTPVQNMQKALNNYRRAQGYNTFLAEDGIFGSSTEAAVRDFQYDHNLGVDGLVGRATKQALLDYCY